MVECLQLIHTL